jgi:hypothetical protein
MEKIDITSHRERHICEMYWRNIRFNPLKFSADTPTNFMLIWYKGQPQDMGVGLPALRHPLATNR